MPRVALAGTPNHLRCTPKDNVGAKQSTELRDNHRMSGQIKDKTIGRSQPLVPNQAFQIDDLFEVTADQLALL